MQYQPRPSDLIHLEWLRALHLGDFQGQNFLDLGCGSGYVCLHAKRQGAQTSVGIDIEATGEAIQSATDWQFLLANLDTPKWTDGLKPGTFDLVTAFDILEHIDSPWLFLAQIKPLLSPQGSLVLTTPNIQSWERRLRPNTWSGASDPQHKTLFSPYSLGFLAERAGFKVNYLDAPMRSLTWLPQGIRPKIGGQLLISLQSSTC